ncbi:MAG: hypothetical protein ACREXR_10035 [Gammaproteobacteria bacterium]
MRSSSRARRRSTLAMVPNDDIVLALALAVFGLSRSENVRELDVVWSRR